LRCRQLTETIAVFVPPSQAHNTMPPVLPATAAKEGCRVF
jgi:hypothetical protein